MSGLELQLSADATDDATRDLLVQGHTVIVDHSWDALEHVECLAMVHVFLFE